MKARAALRAATAEEHERVDQLFSRFDLSEAEDYRRFLLAQATAFLPIEAKLDELDAAALVEDWPLRRRGDALKADLADLGEALPAPLAAPEFGDPSAMLGAIYVLEGSRLGGALLKRSIPADLPRRFLDAPQMPGSWRKLLELLDAFLYEPDRVHSAVGGARHVFHRFEAGGRRYLRSGT